MSLFEKARGKLCFAVSAAELALMLMPFQSFAANEQNKINANDVLGSNNGGGELAEVDQNIRAFGSSTFGVMRTLLIAVAGIMFLVAVMQIIIGGRSRDEGKSKIFWIVVALFAGGAALFIVTTAFNAGAGLTTGTAAGSAS